MILLLESRILERSGAQDPGDLATDELSGLHFTDLFAEGDAASCGEQLLHVTARRMIRDTTHRHLTALGQGDVKDRGGILRIVEEHLVKIPEPEE